MRLVCGGGTLDQGGNGPSRTAQTWHASAAARALQDEILAHVAHGPLYPGRTRRTRRKRWQLPAVPRRRKNFDRQLGRHVADLGRAKRELAPVDRARAGFQLSPVIVTGRSWVT